MKRLSPDRYRIPAFRRDEGVTGWKTYHYCRADLKEGAIQDLSVSINGGDEEFALFLMELGMTNPDRYQYWACSY